MQQAVEPINSIISSLYAKLETPSACPDSIVLDTSGPTFTSGTVPEMYKDLEQQLKA